MIIKLSDNGGINPMAAGGRPVEEPPNAPRKPPVEEPEEVPVQPQMVVGRTPADIKLFQEQLNTIDTDTAAYLKGLKGSLAKRNIAVGGGGKGALCTELTMDDDVYNCFDCHDKPGRSGKKVRSASAVGWESRAIKTAQSNAGPRGSGRLWPKGPVFWPFLPVSRH